MLAVAALTGAIVFAAHSVEADASPPAREPVVHVVQSGDTLWSIARSIRPHGQLAPTIAAIVRRNGLRGADVTLHPGDELVVSR